MSISIRLFEIGMKKLGARRTSHVSGPQELVSFNIENMKFVHSGFRYVLFEGKKISVENRQELSKELGREYVESFDFEFNRIYSFKGLIVLILIITGNYTKQRANKIINESYIEALKCKALAENKTIHIEGMHSEKMLKLYELLAEYDKLINPFGNSEMMINEPIKYLDLLDLDIDYNITQENVLLKISSRGMDVFVRYEANGEEDCYAFRVEEKDKDAGTRRITSFSHILKKKSSVKAFEEILIFNEYLVKLNGNLGGKQVATLNLSLLTGLAWKNGGAEKAKIVTEKQIESAIKYLNKVIGIIKSEITSKMLA